MTVITEQDLLDAAEDAQSLEDVVNGSASPGTVTTRLGQSLSTLAKIEADINTTGTGWLALAEDWASKTDGIVDSTDYSSKAWSVGGTGVTSTSGGGAAKEWAITAEDTLVDTSEYSAKHYAAKAATSATTAAAIVDAAAFSDVVFIDNGDSPYTVDSSNNGDLISVDTSGGNVTINLPTISGITTPFNVAVKKMTSDSFSVTINAGGSDEISQSGTTSATITSLSGLFLAADTDPTPDLWSTVTFGAVLATPLVDNFIDGVDYTSGTSTNVTLSSAPGGEEGTTVTFDGLVQHRTTYSISGATVTFSQAIPLGVSEIEVQYSIFSNGVADGTITAAKLSSSLDSRIANPVTTWYTSGSGNHTTTSNATLLVAEIFGAGGGGGSSDTNAGSNGGSTTFNSITAAGGTGGGAGGSGVAGNGGTGGTDTSTTKYFAGNCGNYGSASDAFAISAPGGACPVFGGAVSGSNASKGAGGAGGFHASGAGGNGGGSGQYVIHTISSPSGSYAYSIGSGGTGGTGTQNGYDGGDGLIRITEYFS